MESLAEVEDQIPVVASGEARCELSGVANATGKSRRSGFEAQAGAQAAPWLKLAATYTYLKSSEQRLAAGLRARELRRPKQSGSLTAIGDWDGVGLTASAAYVGRQRDTNFTTFSPVTLGDYVLVTLAGRYRISEAFDRTARVENAADASYRDVFGYATPGLAAYAGVRVRLGK